MGVYIKDMELPPGGRILIVFPSGRVLEVSADATQDIFRETQAVPVPPHGRLIDADALIAKLNMMIAMAFGEGNTAFHFAYRSLGKVVENAPTIIEAEEGET